MAAYLATVANSMHGRFNSLDCETKRKVVKVSACVFGVIVVRNLCVYAYTYIDRTRTRKKKLEQVQTTKGKLLQKLVGLEKPIENRDTFTSLTYKEIREKLRKREISATDLLEAFQAKALEVDRSLNCVTDVIYDADVTALYLDSLPEAKRGRLHGIPLSVKECINMKDYDCYFGCVSRCFKPEQETACVIEALTNEGMVPFLRTNMSQAGLSIGCANPLFGETVNPFDHTRTCGGSSGGEGAVIGAGGSIVGIGSDIGGSIRIPASHCGVYGFKPTNQRVGHGRAAKMKHKLRPLTYDVSIGPLASDFELLIDVMRVLFGRALFDLDNRIPKLHFDSEVFECEQPMTIGFYTSFSDNRFTLEPVPAVKRAVTEVKAALEARGHTLVEWEPPKIVMACRLLIRNLFIDGSESNRRFVKDELLLSRDMRDLSRSASLSPKLRLVAAGLTWLVNPLLARYIMLSIPPRTSYDVMNLAEEIRCYEKECSRSLSEAGIDAVVCPVLPYAAPLLGDTHNLIFGFLYCNIYNFLDYPAGVVPATRVTEADVQALRCTYPTNSAMNRRVVTTQETSVGMPVGVQCVAMKWQDEKALRLMKEVKKALEG